MARLIHSLKVVLKRIKASKDNIDFRRETWARR